MREIKFREVRENKMYYNLAFYNDNLSSVMTNEKPLIEVIPMQFTGLRDKNNKEIYEGDAKTHFKIYKILQKYNVEQEDIDFILDEFVKFAKESEKANKIFKQFFEFYNNIIIKNNE